MTIFIKTIFKDTKKLKGLEIMYQNAVYICILDLAKFADFRWRNGYGSRTQGVCNVIHIFFGSSVGKV